MTIFRKKTEEPRLQIGQNRQHMVAKLLLTYMLALRC